MMRSAFLLLCGATTCCGAAFVGPDLTGDAPRPADQRSVVKDKTAPDSRMAWWREARFGLFIHWGLYSIPAGQWGEQTNHAEWIRETAHIPVEEYDKFLGQFNPVRFNADEWARMAKEAGMRYIVITSKHHDGFCLFDSKLTDFDVMSTPFKRDILKELSEACGRQGLKMCWYHSIMDWHHPDYLPRRTWETRSAGGADFNRYVQHLRGQVQELLTNYGEIGVMWFDGQWESTWTHAQGQPLYDFCRQVQPSVIINDRVDKGNKVKSGGQDTFAGDFGTPEQMIPDRRIAAVDWETCMTMNDHWGYNQFDHNWKSSQALIRMLADVASKGGNLLLNVGPKADGTFPQESVDRLREIGAWMKFNGDSIYGTALSPFEKLPWGRCTQKMLPGGNARLYLHVFEWPAGGELVVPGVFNEWKGAFLLADPKRDPLQVLRREDAIVIRLPPAAPDPADSVVVLDLIGRADVNEAPTISAPAEIFVDDLQVAIKSDRANITIHYTTDGSDPGATSPRCEGPVKLNETASVRARAVREGKPVSGISEAKFTKVRPRPAVMSDGYQPGLVYEYYEGDWDRLPDFERLQPVVTGHATDFDLDLRQRPEYFALRYRGVITVPRTGVYTFYTLSDDGSRLYVGDQLVVDNDGLHSMEERQGAIALATGAHPLTVTFFEKTGGEALEVFYAGPVIDKQKLPAGALSCPARSAVVTPSLRQLAWQELELQAFVHFGMNTFTDREWGEGTEDPRIFNPTELDARQWIAAFREAGMKGVVLTAKHHDGFCLWPSKYTEHSVKNSPWKDGRGDLVRELADACREAGLKFGIYLSPWDRHEPSYGDSERYNAHYMNQLTELLTDYGPIHEVWFDGACGEGPSGRRQFYDWDGYVRLIRRLQPDAVIFSDAGPDVRWVGNEQGYAGKTNWSMLRRDEFYPGTPGYAALTEGHEDGTHWVPAECDVSIRPGWFHHQSENDKVKSLPQLLDIYYNSVGRNGVLLLNVPPDRTGRIGPQDVSRLADLGNVLRETFRTNLARGKLALAPIADDVIQSAQAVTDGDTRTAWYAPSDAKQAVIIIDLGATTRFDRISLQEDIRRGQRVRAFAVEAWDGERFNTLAEGTTIGYKRLLCCAPTEARRVRLTIRAARGAPAISEIGLYQASPRESGE